MKKSLIILFLFSLLSCNEESTSVKNEEKVFNAQNLSKLELDDFDPFWKGEEINSKSDYISANINSHPNFIKAVRYTSNNKIIGVSVFKTRSAAISAMEERINNVACVILAGDSNVFYNKKWLMTDCIPNAVFLNQWNTIIETSYYHENFNEVKAFLIQSISVLANRVDRLSQ